MKQLNLRFCIPIVALAMAPTLYSQVIWNGAGGDDLWGTGANWIGGAAPSPSTTTDLSFAGSTRLTPNANYTAFDDFRNILFNAGAGSFTVSGNTIDLYGKIENNSTNAQTFNLAIGTGSVTGGFIEIDPTVGDLNIGGSDVFLGNNQLRVWGNNGKTLTFGTGTIISGTGATVAINQNSNVVFQSAHTYTGGTFVNAGTLRFAAGGSANSSTINLLDTTGTVNAAMELAPLAGGLSLSSPLVVRAGSTGTATLSALNTSGTHTLSGSVTLNRGLTVSAATGGALDMTGVISGTGTLTKEGGGNLNLTNNGNSYSGGTVVNNGTLTLNGANTGIGVIKGTLTVNSGATVIGASANALGWQGGANQVTVLNINDGAFTSTVNGDQGWGLTVNMTGGTLSSTGAGAHFSVGNNWAINTFASANTATIAGQLNMRENNTNNTVVFTVADGAAANDLAVSANILAQTAGVGITKAGPGTMTLSGANTYSGATTINGGKVIATSASALGTNTTALTVNTGGTLSWAANGFNTFPSRTINIVGGTVSLDSATNNAHNYTGQTLTLQGGTLTSLNGVAGPANDGGFGNFLLNNSTIVVSGSAQSTISVTNFVTAGAAPSFNVGVTGAPIDLLVSSKIIAGAIVKNGLGTMALSNTNAYAGGTTVNAGTLTVSASQSGSTGLITVAAGAFLRTTFTGFNTWGIGTTPMTIAGTLSADAASSNAHNLGALTLNGGTLTSNNGVAGPANDGGFGNFLLRNTTVGGTSMSTISATQIAIVSGTITVDDAVVGAGVDLLISSKVIDSGGAGNALTKAGLGTMALTGSNTNSGVTTINAGTLQLGIGGTSGSLGAGGVTNNATLAFNRSDAFSVANVISGTGVVQQIGNGTTTLTGVNTYSGGTQALAGKLIVGTGTSTGNNLGSGPLTISSGAAVESKTVYGMGGYTGTITNAGTLTLGTYALVKSPLVLNAGTVEVSGSPYDGNYQGAQLFEKTTVQANALPSIIKNITGAGTNFGVHLRSTGSEFEVADGAAAVDLEVSVSLVNQSGDLGVAPGVLTKTGPGTMALTGVNTYSGGTTINAGALQLSGSGSLLDTGTVNLGPAVVSLKLQGSPPRAKKSGPSVPSLEAR